MSVQSLFNDAREYMQILKACRTDQVAHWRTKDLKRAIQWGIHFENVYAKLSSLNESVREKFNRKLVAVGKEIDAFGDKDQKFDIEFLSHSVQYIAKSLLENSVNLGDELRKELFSNEDILKRINVTQCSEDISRETRLLTKLMEIQSSFLYDPSSCVIPVSGETVVNSVSLLEELKRTANFDDTIQHHVIKSGGMDIVLSCLIITKLNQNEQTRTKLLKWFEGNLNEHIQPSKTGALTPCLLAATSVQDVEFSDIYIRGLTTITEECNTESMVPALAPPTAITYQEIFPFWKSLYETSLKEKAASVIGQQAQRFEGFFQKPTMSINCVWKRLSEL